MSLTSASAEMTSLRPRSLMNLTAAGQRSFTFSCSCAKLEGGRTTRLTSRLGSSIASLTVTGGRLLSLATKPPWRWQERRRRSSITGVLLASESSKPASTASTIACTFGRGSSSHIWDFIAKEWERSCMIEEPSP